jgi:hypothetical protein
LPLADGGGLQPLRFSEADIAECTAASCVFTTPSGVVVIVLTGDVPVVCLIDYGPESGAETVACNPSAEVAHLWRWHAASSQMGGTAFKDGVRLKVGAMPPCANRPWDPCPPASDETG